MQLAPSRSRPFDAGLGRWFRLVLPPTCVAALMLFACPCARAADQAAVDKGKRFVDDRGTFVLGYLHFGSTYKKHSCVAVVNVNDRSGRPLPGQFCLRYQFDWKNGFGDGVTTVDFLFDERGQFYLLNNWRSNAGILNQPFATANLSIQVLGNLIYEAFKNDLNKDDRQVVRNLIDNADAHALLQWSLRFQQVLRR